MKTCLIYSPDGVDLDNAVNLIRFYKRLGFNTFFSDELFDADVLALVRARNAPVNVEGCNFSLIHIYDYVGWDYDEAIRSFDYSKTYIYCTSEEKRERIIKEVGFPEDHIHLAFTPVEIPLWSRKVKPVKYDVIHVGNYKPVPGGDKMQDRFINIIDKYKVHLWGARWKGIISDDNYHGRKRLFGVPRIYARSKFALGLMYPYQREVTFSNRFWIASLCGCPVISEKGLYTTKLPGVVETDYTDADYERIIREVEIDRAALREEALLFWEKENAKTLSYLKPTLSLIERRKYSFGYRMKVYKIMARNFRRICYHTSFVYDLVQKLKS